MNQLGTNMLHDGNPLLLLPVSALATSASIAEIPEKDIYKLTASSLGWRVFSRRRR